MTFYAVTIGALASWLLTGRLDWPLYLALLAGFTLAHLADNLLNDLYDYKSGLDDPGYFRSLYGPHPVIDGIVKPRTISVAVAAILALDASLALYLSIRVTPLIGLLAAVGAASMALYAGYPFDAKRLGLGELLVAVVWGPVMAGGTLLALAGKHPPTAALAYLPFAAAVSLVLIGKHMDKYDHDRARGVGTLPVRLGLDASARLAAAIALLAPPLAAAGVYDLAGHPIAALAATALATGSASTRIVLERKPPKPPEGWSVWPLWYVAAAYAAMDSLGRATVGALLASGLALAGHGHLAALVGAVFVAWEAASALAMHRVAEAAKRISH